MKRPPWIVSYPELLPFFVGMTAARFFLPARSVAAPPAPSRRFFFATPDRRGVSLTAQRAPGRCGPDRPAYPPRVSTRPLASLSLVHAPRALALAVVLAAACSDVRPQPLGAAPPSSLLRPGEICDASNPTQLRLSFDPPVVVVAPGAVRPVRLTVEPDVCAPAVAAFASDSASIAAAPAPASLDLRHATYDFEVKGGAGGTTALHATMTSHDGAGVPYTVTADLPVDVRDAAPPSCAAGETARGTLAAGATTLAGAGALAASYLSVPPGAFARSDELALPAFPATIACSEDRDLTTALPDAQLRPLGPAVRFEVEAPLSMGTSLRREVEIALPVNPAAFPAGARLRHLTVLYKRTGAGSPEKARPIPVANARIEPDGRGGYVLKLQTPWFGTYQAAVAASAGSVTHKRHLTHRAVIGISMGGGGAAAFGMRHHDQFDVIAPLGGPSDWSWMLWYVEQNAMGGFCPAGQTCPKVAPNRYPGMNETFAHTMDYEHWFYERGAGNGGTFPRSEYVQIFEDLALAMGNPNGSGTDPSTMGYALGPKRNDPSLVMPDGTDCAFTVDPVGDDAAAQQQRDVEARCRAYRCDPKNVYRAPKDYFDDEYNPDGTLPVIGFCDGGQVPDAPSPYVNTWAPGGDKPVGFALAVDRNGNGIRDEGEPVIRSGHEPYLDCGVDQLCDKDEPGYDAEKNPDPSGDDYDYQLQPTGTEGNHRWDAGERFSDVGLDGVPDTATRHVAGDPGEGDGLFTSSLGVANFAANDPHEIMAGRTTKIPGGALTDDALRRFDVLSDGGVRDLFNFESVANHLIGQVHGRRTSAGLPIRSTAFYNGFHFLPGEPSDKPNQFEPANIRWADVADMPSIRYGEVDATREIIERDGDGQHVGIVTQRLQTSVFYVAKRWPGADRRHVEESREDPAASTINELGVDCEVAGTCEKIFTGPRTGRTGPIAVTLPPGYASKASVADDVRYPVLYVLHGYGQDPRDLAAVGGFLAVYQNGADRSYATRLPKMLVVYVDGRCRVGKDGKPECVRGTFFMNSARPEGPQLDDWFEEVMEYVDRNYRTMKPADVDVTD
ncbi:MAG: uncharacterized protein JWP97_1279 [Labilithrix sp.]|nr:uncharacterized protein [Labilithrix sp.]